jgi:hypothetical protein
VLNYLTKLYELGALPVIRPGATQTLAVGPASAASSAIGADVVRLLSTVDVHLAFGAAPVADANCLFLPANLPEYFACEAGDQVAAIQDSVGGTLYITPAEE